VYFILCYILVGTRNNFLRTSHSLILAGRKVCNKSWDNSNVESEENEELTDLYSSPNIILVIKLGRM
jgi:hypothetical protein